MALNSQQELFCREYLVDLNATAAYVRAGYSPVGANRGGHRQLLRPEVAARIQELFKARARRVDSKADRVLEELERLAFFDIRKAIQWGQGDIQFTPSSVIDEDTARAIQKIKAKTTRIDPPDGGPAIERVEIELVMASKLGALTKLGEHHGLWGGVEGATPPVPPPASTFTQRDMSKQSSGNNSDADSEPDDVEDATDDPSDEGDE